MKIYWLSDHALCVEWGQASSMALSSRIHAIATEVRGCNYNWLAAIVPGICTLTFFLHSSFEPQQIEQLVLKHCQQTKHIDQQKRVHEIRFHLFPESDLSKIADYSQLSIDSVIEQFCEASYQVAMIGFAPGFPYLLGLPAALHMPRKAAPSIRVPKGAVAIANEFAGIYPSAMPGGWHIIGVTNLSLFDPSQSRPSLLQPGDQVRFVRHVVSH